MAVVFHITCKHCGETADYDSWLATHEQILPFNTHAARTRSTTTSARQRRMGRIGSQG